MKENVKSRKSIKNLFKGKKKIIAIIIVIILVLLILMPKGRGRAFETVYLTDTTQVTYGQIKNTVSAAGTVESASSMSVYSSLNYPVEEIMVKVGDYVEQGQVMAQLDSHSVQNAITSQQIALEQSSANANQGVKAAQDNYDNFKDTIDQGLNTSLNSAQSQKDSAYDTYQKAIETYERFEKSIADGENTTLINAQTSLKTAQSNLESVEESYANAEDDEFEARSSLALTKTELSQKRESLQAVTDEISQTSDTQELATLNTQKATLEKEILVLEQTYSTLQMQATTAKKTLESLETQLRSAEIARDSAQENYNAVSTTIENTRKDYKDNIETAKKNYETASKSVESAQKAVSDQLNSYENSVISAQIGANTSATQESIRQLRADLADTTITAPCSGTVTAVYAKVGSSGAGLLFIIEDTENLVVETTVKEYDMGTVKEGQSVDITSASTDDQVFEGVITSIAPAAIKNAYGETDTSSDISFEAQVEVLTKDSGLHIGMETQLDYIIDQKDNVLVVPFDAVYKNNNGEHCVIEVVDKGDNQYLLQEIVVEAGTEDDMNIEIKGEQVKENMTIIKQADDYIEKIGKTMPMTDKKPSNPFMMGGMR